jgi:beta-mannanase
MDFDDIIAMVTQLQPEGLDIKALKIELKANNFYRGNPYVDAVGSLLGFTKEQLDKFFETNDYTYLLTTNQVTNQVEEVTDGE